MTLAELAIHIPASIELLKNIISIIIKMVLKNLRMPVKQRDLSFLK